MFILTNVSQDIDGWTYAEHPTFFNTEDEAIKNAKENLAKDFYISVEDVEEKANVSGPPTCLTMSQNGRLEVYTVSEIPGIKKCVDGYEISNPLPNGGELVAYTGVSDYDTRQAGILYYDKEGNPLDLALAEVRRGELAVSDGKDPDNEDIDLMVWGDIYSEDYTEKITFEKEKIEDAFKS